MLLQIPDVLTAEEVARCRQALDAAEWVDGGVTAGAQSGQVKRNMQIPEGSAAHRQLGEAVLTALGRNPQFLSGALPQRVFPPLFNRYQGGHEFGAHVDNAIRQLPGGGQRIRTDLSATLFFTGPDEYQGGELVVEDTYGQHRVKGPAGSLVLYPSTSLHHVTPVAEGARVASFFWIQSMVRDDGQRTMLYNLDTTIQNLRDEGASEDRLVELTAHYHNLLRRWADL